MKHYLRYPLLLLLSITFAITSRAQKMVDGINYELNRELFTASVTSMGEYTGDITIPNSVVIDDDTYTVTEIGDFAFSYCAELTSIKLPETVTRIGEYAFSSCTALVTVDLSNTLKSIGYNAFFDCPALSSITFPESLESIGATAFSYCI